MKILFLESHLIQYKSPIYEEMALRNVNFEVLYCCANGQVESFDKDFGLRFKWDRDLSNGYPFKILNKGELNLSNFFGLGFGLRVFLQGKLWSYDAIVIPGWNYFAFLSCIYISALLGKRIYIRNDMNNLMQRSRTKSIIHSIFMKTIALACKGVFYVGLSSKDFYSKYFTEQKLYYSPFAIDQEYFKCEKSLFARSKNWSSRLSNKIVFVGKINDNKNPQLILDSLEFYDFFRFGRLHLYFIGDGVLREQLTSLSRFVALKYGSDRVIIEFLGFLNQSEVRQFLCGEVNFICLPSKNESWGLCVNEAIALGVVPLVSSSCGVSLEVNKHFGKEYVFETNSPTSLAACFSQVFSKNNYPLESIVSFNNEYHITKSIDGLLEGIHDC